MRRWRAMQRRLLWTSVVFGLLLLVAVVSVLRAGLWVRDGLVPRPRSLAT
jgi:hypothetical protein